MVTSESNGRPDLRKEAVLDPAITFHNRAIPDPASLHSALLTGATGHVGVYLLHELLQKTTADIYCLVRGDQTEAVRDRLREKMGFFSLWNETLSPRIIPVIGDLSKPFFGLSEREFCALAEKIDMVFHNGANVNFLRPYSTLKPVNILGTQEVIRFAARQRPKSVHMISTMVVFFSKAYSPTDRIKETEVPKYDPEMVIGYNQSKWVADKLVLAAMDRGLPACIYRPVRILGHSENGKLDNPSDFLLGLIKCCIQMGKYPSPEFEISLPFVPVDYVSEAVVHLSQHKKSLGKAFHLVNPRPITWKDLFAAVGALGYPLEEIPYRDWVTSFKEHVSQRKKDPFLSRFSLFLRLPNNLFFAKPHFDASQTTAGLRDSSIVCHPVDQRLISAYMGFLHKSGFIPAPTRIAS